MMAPSPLPSSTSSGGAPNPGRGVKLSVCVITYNQQRYIRQCLQSIVDQQTDFAFEVIVGDDLSMDGTREIVQEFADRYPDVIVPLLHDPKIGGTANYLAVHRAARGEYIAHIDGDDYMLPGKLQTQVDALDANPDCSVCVHEVKRFDEAAQRFLKAPRKVYPRKSDLEFLLMNLPFFAHSSKMYRAECNRGLESATGDILDCYFHVHHALTGGILYLESPLAVYRVNVGTSTQPGAAGSSAYRAPSMSLVELGIAAVEHARTAGIESSLIRRAEASIWFDYSYALLMAKQFDAFRSCIRKSLATARLHRSQAFFGLFADVPYPLYWFARVRAAVRTFAV